MDGLIQHLKQVYNTKTILLLSQWSTLLCFVLALLVVPEWLFLATKGSFLDVEPTLRSTLVFFNAIFFMAIYSTAVFTILLLVLGPVSTQVLVNITSTVCLFIAVLLMSDNLTHNLLKTGILNLHGWSRVFYLIVSTLVFFIIYNKIDLIEFSSKTLVFAFTCLLTSGLIALFTNLYWTSRVEHKPEVAIGTQPDLPNIILFASDGVEAEHLSVYGYSRETTPYLQKFAQSAVTFENAFTNAGKTISSTTSMLTGKNPLTTGVFNPYNLLMGKNADEHLPGILKQHGYVTFQESSKFWADSVEINMRNSFDHANGRKVRYVLIAEYILPRVFFIESKFLNHILAKFEERLFHILDSRKSDQNHLEIVTNKVHARDLLLSVSDDARISNSLRFLESATGPFFAHIHLISQTHCSLRKNRSCRFSPKKKNYSLVEDATEDDLYDDAIAGSDEDFGKILDWLERKNKLKNTIVVYSSDHGRRWSIDRKVPLLFRFPTLHGPLRRTDNASLLDIAPTLLDYLHLDIPKYMEGRSLLENYESVPILAVEGDIPVERVLHIDCQHWSSVALNEDKVRQGIFAHHTSPCSNQPLTRMEVRKQVIDYVLPRAKMIRKAPGTLMERLWYGEIAH